MIEKIFWSMVVMVVLLIVDAFIIGRGIIILTHEVIKLEKRVERLENESNSKER